MGRIARKKAASGIVKWVVILAAVFAVLYFYLGSGDEKTSTSEPTREVIGVSVKPGQGYDTPKTQPKEDDTAMKSEQGEATECNEETERSEEMKSEQSEATERSEEINNSMEEE